MFLNLSSELTSEKTKQVYDLRKSEPEPKMNINTVIFSRNLSSITILLRKFQTASLIATTFLAYQERIR